tara:strand:+ start:5470 stop:5940 length:471 start_codon:yes stop_codon:yes gene_type:complete
MNKILIALVLAVGLSGNAYAELDRDDVLFLACSDEISNKVEIFVINKDTNKAFIEYVSIAGEIEVKEYILKILDYSITLSTAIIRSSPTMHYSIDRRTLKIEMSDFLKSTIKYSKFLNYKITNLSLCKVSSQKDKNELLERISSAKKIQYEKEIKF